ncbi:MAG: hypothetical protein ACTSX1_11365 [Candidatus Heimdallarchaeaceae archaeon]
MTITGFARTSVFEAIYKMVDVHDGHFDYSDKNDFIFTFQNADDKHNCLEAINSLSFRNVLVTKLHSLSIRVDML